MFLTHFFRPRRGFPRIAGACARGGLRDGHIASSQAVGRARRGERIALGQTRWAIRALYPLGDLVVSGPTYSNVNDFRAVWVR